MLKRLQGKIPESFKRAVLPLAFCLWVLSTMPLRRFGWLDVELSVIAIVVAALAVFAISHVWEKLRRRPSY